MKYTLHLCRLIHATTIVVHELCENGDSLFEKFFEENMNVYKAELASIIRIIEETSNLRRYPNTKFREIKDHDLLCKLYEAKSKHLRVYLFHEENTGRIIVSGGLKRDQNRDLRIIIKKIKHYYNER